MLTFLGVIWSFVEQKCEEQTQDKRNGNGQEKIKLCTHSGKNSFLSHFHFLMPDFVMRLPIKISTKTLLCCVLWCCVNFTTFHMYFLFFQPGLFCVKNESILLVNSNQTKPTNSTKEGKKNCKN